MIFVAAGTQDGRELVGQLLQAGHRVIASVVSSYGEQLLLRYGTDQLQVNDVPLDETALRTYLKEHAVRCFIDASHPYAVNVSIYAMAACRQLHIPYIRYERQVSAIAYAKLFRVQTYEEAANQAALLGKRIFLTTGSRNLACFMQSPAIAGCSLTIRVLPVPEVLAACTELGFTPANIIAMQGPFSAGLNQELFKKYEADVIVTKNSGTLGGTDTKLEAAMQLELPVVMIDRPKLCYTNITYSFAGVFDFIQTKMTK